MSEQTATESVLSDAKAALRAGNVAQAIGMFESVLKSDERLIEAHEGLAVAHYGQKNYAEAVKHFQRIAMLDPRKGTSLVNAGAIYNLMKDHQKAVDVLRKGLSRDKRSSEGYYNLGIAHKGLNQLSLAVSAYREAIKLDPEMAEAYQNLANVYAEMGNHQAAIAHFEKALEIRPNFEKARRGLAKVQDASVQAKLHANPFGRLVGSGPAHQIALRKLERELTDEERFRDRMALNGIAVEMIRQSAKWLESLKERLDPDLTTLHRIITHDEPSPFVLHKGHLAVQEAIELNSILRKNLKRKLLELRAHEELILTSTLSTPRM